MNPLSGVIGEAWQMYRRYARHLLAIAFVIYLVAAIVEALVSHAGTLTGALLATIVSLLAAFGVQAALVKAVQDVRDGRVDLSLRETVSAAGPAIASVAVAALLAGVAISIGLLVFIIPGLYLITIWAVIVPVIVIERSGALSSFGRSYELVCGRAWNVFGTLVLVFIILFLVQFALGGILQALPAELRAGISAVVAGTLVAPFLALVVTLMYYRLNEAPAPDSGPRRGRRPGSAA